MSKVADSMFSKIIRALPRMKLDEFSGVSEAWRYDRKELENRVIACQTQELREDILDYLKHLFGVR